MKRMSAGLRCSFGLLAALAFSGCAGHDSRCAQIPGGGRYCLQTTAAVEPFDVQQKVEATLSGRRETMIFELEVDGDGMRLVGLTPFGQKLIQLRYDNRDASADRLPDERLPPALLLSLLQLALWPANSVRSGLDPSLALSESADQRRILADGKVLVEVSYRGDRRAFGEMRIALPSAAMELEIVTLETTSTP
jgi:hypothetical protein